MKNVVTLFLFVLAGLSAKSQVSETQILGEWLSPKKNNRVLIYKQGEKYFGKITWGTGPTTKDEKNPTKELRTRELVGLVILNNFKFDGDDTWENGSIYDPREGKNYSCKMTLKDANNLSIRGYVGISLFGRSETWTKFK